MKIKGCRLGFIRILIAVAIFGFYFLLFSLLLLSKNEQSTSLNNETSEVEWMILSNPMPSSGTSVSF